ncbi:Ubiquitin carboxyl-terminal hydrolase 43 [Liparis tanakae]|uniref:Ubiquitin carboxyl-terminal hydrolase 43 n=1 Tax=Liparis tanakae TaxID=230148 RepID=A0A4Z2H001_9TELE|nr:Ubiquitin carboxyl-terminal hydrolase 43 [Liparis tanakae]
MNDAAHVHLLRRGGFILSDQKFFKVKASAAAASQVSRLQGPPAGGGTKQDERVLRPAAVGLVPAAAGQERREEAGCSSCVHNTGVCFGASRSHTIVSKYGSQFRGNSQHDALEFLLWLLDRVHEDVNMASHNNNNTTKAPAKMAKLEERDTCCCAEEEEEEEEEERLESSEGRTGSSSDREREAPSWKSLWRGESVRVFDVSSLTSDPDHC